MCYDTLKQSCCNNSSVVLLVSAHLVLSKVLISWYIYCVLLLFHFSSFFFIQKTTLSEFLQGLRDSEHKSLCFVYSVLASATPPDKASQRERRGGGGCIKTEMPTQAASADNGQIQIVHLCRCFCFITLQTGRGRGGGGGQQITERFKSNSIKSFPF